MTPEEKAKCGLWLLKEATLDYLAARPEGVSSRTAREALGLDSADPKGQHAGYLFWGLYHLLEHEGKVTSRDHLLFRVSQTEPQAAQG
jgi:hypothetical protein